MIYTILKNWHYSLPPYPFMVFGKGINKKINFSKEAWTETYPNQYVGINKLFGISFGILGVHKNSFRIGWMSNPKQKNTIDLYAYYYDNNNVHTSLLLETISAGLTYNMSIRWDSNNVFEVDIDGENVFCKTLKIKQSKLKFFHRPYHGGKERSKNKYWIIMKKETYNV